MKNCYPITIPKPWKPTYPDCTSRVLFAVDWKPTNGLSKIPAIMHRKLFKIFHAKARSLLPLSKNDPRFENIARCTELSSLRASDILPGRDFHLCNGNDGHPAHRRKTRSHFCLDPRVGSNCLGNSAWPSFTRT